jgi:hypothetical protein
MRSMRFELVAGRRAKTESSAPDWVAELSEWFALRLAALPLGPDGGWLEVRLVTSTPKPAAISGRSTIIERLVVEVAHDVRERASPEYWSKNCTGAFDAIRRALAEPSFDAIAQAEGYDAAGIRKALEAAWSAMPSDASACMSEMDRLRHTASARVRTGRALWRIQHPRPLTRELVGLRAYGAVGESMPDVELVVVCLEAQLRDRHFRTPGYREIYFRIENSLEAAERSSSDAEVWFRETPTVLDAAALRNCEEGERLRTVLDAFEQGLLRIAQLDHLDTRAIVESCAELQSGGFDREIILLEAKSATHDATVFHESRATDGYARRFWLRVVDRRSGRVGLRELGTFTLVFERRLFGTLALKRGVVRVTGRGSYAAKVEAKVVGAPEQWEFALAELFP